MVEEGFVGILTPKEKEMETVSATATATVSRGVRYWEREVRKRGVELARLKSIARCKSNAVYIFQVMIG